MAISPSWFTTLASRDINLNCYVMVNGHVLAQEWSSEIGAAVLFRLARPGAAPNS